MPSFPPLDFKTLAGILAPGSAPLKDAKQRTAVSRAYYAAFLTARERLREVPHFGPVKRHGAHDNVLKALIRSGDPVLTPIGRTLSDLRDMREAADYDLDPATLDPTTVTEALRLSDEVLTDLGSADVSKCVDPRRA